MGLRRVREEIRFPDSESLRAQILRHLTFTLARDPHTATTRDWWISTAMAVRDHILEDFIASTEPADWSVEQWRELLRTGRLGACSQGEPVGFTTTLQIESERSAT